MKLKTIIIACCYLLLSAPVQSSTDNELAKLIQHNFAIYRDSIDSAPSTLGEFFTKEINENWLGYILENSSSEEASASLRSVKSRASFGKRIVSVYQFSVTQEQPESAVAKIIYSNGDGEGPFLYTLKYLREGGEWRIGEVHSDTSKPGPSFNGKVIHTYE